jgi:hypothetical protein
MVKIRQVNTTFLSLKKPRFILQSHIKNLAGIVWTMKLKGWTKKALSSFCGNFFSFVFFSTSTGRSVKAEWKR